MKDGKFFININDYLNVYILFDVLVEEYEGGSGKIFDWDKINRDMFIKNKLIIVGGLNV